ncbi:MULTISPECIES: hypothetical protein [unclassified Sedimentibacter]|uniref:hypothetical protein n=1 Tax=unclassified Sedimentibacter TaxID=2649220 RepID=UPI0027E10AD5|nr:hypothetical protein [Sedimentibacter sp. MB35-C1]WMJ75870.1 hypothetical protein RBQ61_09525 [Sedimentibacter sp. MB35-C1]
MSKLFKSAKMTLIAIVAVIYMVLSLFIFYKTVKPSPVILYPSFQEIEINTPDRDNPAVKLLSFQTTVVNRSKKHIDLKLYFYKDKKSQKWYPYYDLIPEVYVTEVYRIEPGQKKEISSETIIESDDERLINSYLLDVKVKYKVVK